MTSYSKSYSLGTGMEREQLTVYDIHVDYNEYKKGNPYNTTFEIYDRIGFDATDEEYVIIAMEGQYGYREADVLFFNRGKQPRSNDSRRARKLFNRDDRTILREI